jgi:hypothetical protein
MAGDTTLLNAAADAAGLNLEGAFFAIQDGNTNADQTSDQRLAPDYNAASGGVAALAATLSFTGPSSEAVSHLGVWDTIGPTGGNLRFAVDLVGDLFYNSAGDLDLTAAPITVT